MPEQACDDDQWLRDFGTVEDIHWRMFKHGFLMEAPEGTQLSILGEPEKAIRKDDPMHKAIQIVESAAAMHAGGPPHKYFANSNK